MAGSHVYVRQIKPGKMDLFTYLVGDPVTRDCMLIDPAFNTGRLLSIAKEAGYKVRLVVNTHGHADHVCGNAAIIAATGARLMIHEKDAPFTGRMVNRLICRALGGKPSPPADVLLRHGEYIKLGELVFTVLHTPGHTPGSICIYTRGHLFAGDTLFVGSVGRTDLPGGSAEQLTDSICRQIFSLPDDTRIWPGHDYGVTPSSTLLHEKRTNPFMRPCYGQKAT